jgi:hypothetical protein
MKNFTIRYRELIFAQTPVERDLQGFIQEGFAIAFLRFVLCKGSSSGARVDNGVASWIEMKRYPDQFNVDRWDAI